MAGLTLPLRLTFRLATTQLTHLVVRFSKKTASLVSQYSAQPPVVCCMVWSENCR